MGIFLRHALFWICIYLIWTYMKSYGEVSMTFLRDILANMVVYMMIYYTLRRIQIPLLLNKGKAVLFIISLVLSVTIVYIVWRVLGLLWFDEIIDGNYLLETVQSYVPAMALFAIEMHADRRNEQQKRVRLEKESMASELKLLKAQVNPQFLLNTLKSLYIKVADQSTEAPVMIMELSSLLDYVLYRSQKTTVTLKEELAAIEYFISLEQMKRKNQLDIAFHSKGDTSMAISPLILLSLIQDIFGQLKVEEWDMMNISIDIEIKKSVIDLRISYFKEPRTMVFNKSMSSTIELSNIEHQLDLAYPGRYKLSIDDSENVCHVLLTLNPLLP